MTPKENIQKDEKAIQSLEEICENTRAIRRVVNRILDHLHETLESYNNDDYDPDDVSWEDLYHMLGKSSLHQDLIKNLLFANWIASEECSSAVGMVAFGNVSPKKAIEMIERSYQSGSIDTEENNSTKRFNGRIGDILGESLN